MKRMLFYGLFLLTVAGCTREPPPETPKEKTPPKLTLAESTVPELVSAVTPSAALPPPPPPMAKPMMKAPPPPPPSAAAPPPVKAEAAPTIIGTWQVQEIYNKGQLQPMPPGMTMVLTFDEGGSVTMTMSNPKMAQPMTVQGSYTFGNGQITLNLKNDSKSGTYQFDGANRITLDLGDGKMVLVRS